MKQLRIYTYKKENLGSIDGCDQLSSNSGSIKYSESGKEVFSLTYKSLTYDFRIYEPSELHITLTCTPSTTENGSPVATFTPQLAVSMLKADFLPKIETEKKEQVKVDVLASGDKELATGFYVHSLGFVSAKVDNKSSYEVVLHCFSPDKKLTINKYCQVFCGKKLGEDIFNNNNKDFYEKFGLKDLTEYDVKKLNYLSYIDENKKEKLNELLQPYLVQYNESYYDFLRRVAHRCGEFLYYRAGKFCLGLPQPTENPTSFSVSAECSYPEIVDEDSVGIEVVSFSGDYVKNRNEDEAKSKSYYNSPYAGDENFHVLDDDDRKQFTDFWGDWVYFSMTFEAMTGEDVVEVVQNAATELARIGVGYGFVKKQVKDDYDDNYKNGYAEKMGFTPMDVSNYTFLNKFYYEIEHKALKARQNQIQLDCSNNLPQERLGDAFLWGSKDVYVVTRMQGSFVGDSSQHCVEAVPAQYDNSKNRLTADPPLQDFPFCLKSAPQEAVVCDAADPLKMGRVRIRYLWQKVDKDYSPWIRMVVPFASGSGGMVMTPQKGDHLMINYIGENIERPYAEGALYHSDQRCDPGYVEVAKKYFKPDYPARVISSANGHSISFLDKSGWIPFLSGLFPLAGQAALLTKAILKKTENDNSDFDEVENGNALSGGIVLRDYNDINNIQMSADGRFISVSSSLGKVEINAFTGITIDAPNGNISIKGKNISLEAGNNISIHAGGNIRDKDSVVGPLGGAIGGFLGAVTKQAAREAIKWGLGAAIDPWKFTDVSFLRSVWEVFMRPVEGSLKLQSNRNVVMTAGTGAVTVPVSLLSNVKRTLGKTKSVHDLQDNSYKKQDMNQIIDLLDAYKVCIEEFVSQAFDFICSIIDRAIRAASYLQQVERDYLKERIKDKLIKDPEKLDEIEKRILCDALAGEEYKVTDFIKRCDSNQWILNTNDFSMFLCFEKEYERVKNDMDSFITRYDAGNALNESLTAEYNGKKASIESLGQKYTCNFDHCLGSDYSQNQVWIGLLDRSVQFNQNKVKKNLVLKVFKSQLDQFSMLEGSDATINNVEEWATYVDSLQKREEGGSGFIDGLTSLGEALGNELLGGYVEFDDGKPHYFRGIQQLLNINGAAGPRAVWDVASGGNILLSNSSDITYKLNETSKGWIPMLNPSLFALKEYLGHVFDTDMLPRAHKQ